jgi:hypothetical protein
LFEALDRKDFDRIVRLATDDVQGIDEISDESGARDSAASFVRRWPLSAIGSTTAAGAQGHSAMSGRIHNPMLCRLS